MREMQAAGIAMEFPTAVPIPYTLQGGGLASVWFDRTGGFDPSFPELTGTVEASTTLLEERIDHWVKMGVAPDKIAIGGFSMGGSIALQTAFRSRSVGSVFAMSSYLCDDAKVWSLVAERIEAERMIPNVWQAHGTADDFIRFAWGEATSRRFEGLGVPIQFVPVPGIDHTMADGEIRALTKWLKEQLDC